MVNDEKRCDVETLKVSARSNPNSVAGAMAGVVRQSGAVMVQTIGAGALNQAVKAMAIARGFVAPSGLDLICVPSFADVEIEGERRTAIRLCIEDRMRRTTASDDSTVRPVEDLDLTELPAPNLRSSGTSDGSHDTDGFQLP